MAALAFDIAGMIDDRPEDKAFTIDRRLFTDPRIYALEVRYIFENTWVFVGLDSQIPNPDGFITGYIGRQPIILMRDKEGAIGCFLNTCRHRGTIVCPFKRGQRKLHVCRYHGWTYDSSGRNLTVTAMDDGQYPPSFAEENHDLVKVARLGNYRGFIFASLSPDVPPIDEHLGEARKFLDLVIDQSPVGRVEFVPGESTYTFDANWKLQFENGLDYYHFASTHSSYVDILKRRPQTAASSAGRIGASEDETEGQGSFNFNYGHAVNWSIKKQQLYGRPLGYDPVRLAALRAKLGETREVDAAAAKFDDLPQPAGHRHPVRASSNVASTCSEQDRNDIALPRAGRRKRRRASIAHQELRGFLQPDRIRELGR
jgi:phenylpropionate dioxygenase-like ring-hydroxylating dioxygenase large terminal subunit